MKYLNSIRWISWIILQLSGGFLVKLLCVILVKYLFAVFNGFLRVVIVCVNIYMF